MKFKAAGPSIIALMNEVWVIEAFTLNMRPTAFDPQPSWIKVHVAESKRLADAWREDREEMENENRESGYHYSGYDTRYRTVRYVPEV